MKTLRTLILICFPMLSYAFLYFTSEFIAGVRKGSYFSWKFSAISVLYFLLIAGMLYFFVYHRGNISWAGVIIGEIVLIVSCFHQVWMISIPLFNAIWSLYPYHYFLLGICITIYAVMILIKIKEKA